MIEANWDIATLVGLMTLLVATVQLYVSWRQMRWERLPPPRVGVVALVIEGSSEKEVIIIRVYYLVIKRALKSLLAMLQKSFCSAIPRKGNVEQLHMMRSLYHLCWK